MILATIPATQRSPEIHFEEKSSILFIEGSSTMDDPMAFYKPIIEWLEGYLNQNKNQKITINIDFEFFNDDSSKALLHILYKLENSDSLVVWNYRLKDIEIKEAGENFSDMLNLNFELKERV
jgi:hypothetical protein